MGERETVKDMVYGTTSLPPEAKEELLRSWEGPNEDARLGDGMTGVSKQNNAESSEIAARSKTASLQLKKRSRENFP